MLTNFEVKLRACPKVLFGYFIEKSVRRGRTSQLVKQFGKEMDVNRELSFENPPKIRSNPAIKKINTPEFRSIFSEELCLLLEIFKKYNHEIRVAGGAVRDILMEIKPKDVDLATTATPLEMKDMFTKEKIRTINAKGESHGTITARISNKENFEVTTLRIDVQTDGRHAKVVYTTNWQLDANRRDLTINSMYLGFDGTVYDYFYGYDDLVNRRVVFVGNPIVRIQEDYLRILRYFRFYGRIALEASQHDELTLRAIRDNVSGLGRISGERIWCELKNIVIGNFPLEVMLKMIDCGIAPYCGLPEQPNVKSYKRFCQNIEKFPKPYYPILYLISLLHTPEDGMRLHERLKLSAFERDLTLFIMQQRAKVDKTYLSLRDYQKLCLQPFAKRQFVEELLKISNKLDLYNSLKTWSVPNFPINGNILHCHGCPSGKTMGSVMSELKLLWADSDFKLTESDLINQHLPKILKSIDPTLTSSPPKKQRK